MVLFAYRISRARSRPRRALRFAAAAAVEEGGEPPSTRKFSASSSSSPPPWSPPPTQSSSEKAAAPPVAAIAAFRALALALAAKSDVGTRGGWARPRLAAYHWRVASLQSTILMRRV